MPQDEMYLTIDRDKEAGGYIAVITRGHPQRGDEECTVLSVERVKDRKEAEAWYMRMKIEQPWNERN